MQINDTNYERQEVKSSSNVIIVIVKLRQGSGKERQGKARKGKERQGKARMAKGERP